MGYFEKVSPEQRAEWGRQGGSKRKEDYKSPKSIAETLKYLLQLSLKTGKIDDIEKVKAFSKLNGKNITVAEAMAVVMVQKALNGDSKAFELVRDLVGERPEDTMNIRDITPVIISDEKDILD